MVKAHAIGPRVVATRRCGIFVSVTVDPSYAILEVDPNSTLDEVKSAYYRAAKKHHPDLFPHRERDHCERRMMRVNEAYRRIAAARMKEAPNGAGSGGEGGSRSPETPRPAGPARNPGTAVGRLRDPAYVHYKLGFHYYSLGSMQLDRKDPRVIRQQLAELRTTGYHVLELALRALALFSRSQGYFLTVVEAYPQSIWTADARYKLRRIERYMQLYQRICENLSQSLARRRYAEATGSRKRPTA